MQISSNLLFDRSASRMSALMATANQLQTQIATGKKINTPSDNVAVAQQLAGHASPTTTAGYDRRGERAKEQAASRLDVPYDG